jgi:hypothetical protein
MNAATTEYRIIYLTLARPVVWDLPALSMGAAMKALRQVKRTGRTAWIETTAGQFVPVKGCMRRPGHLQAA